MDKFEEYFDREQDRLDRQFSSGLLDEQEYNRKCRYLEKNLIRNFLRSEDE